MPPGPIATPPRENAAIRFAHAEARRRGEKYKSHLGVPGPASGEERASARPRSARPVAVLVPHSRQRAAPEGRELAFFSQLITGA